MSVRTLGDASLDMLDTIGVDVFGGHAYTCIHCDASPAYTFQHSDMICLECWQIDDADGWRELLTALGIPADAVVVRSESWAAVTL